MDATKTAGVMDFLRSVGKFLEKGKVDVIHDASPGIKNFIKEEISKNKSDLIGKMDKTFSVPKMTGYALAGGAGAGVANKVIENVFSPQGESVNENFQRGFENSQSTLPYRQGSGY